MERLLEDISFDAPEMPGKRIEIDAAYVRQRLSELAQDEDLSKFIL
jgi:ATP-dependent HslUV protease ATP-binding subunit HslU